MCSTLCNISCGCALFLQTVREGSPTHPSYPSGHAVQNGAFSTLLKVCQDGPAHCIRFSPETTVFMSLIVGSKVCSLSNVTGTLDVETLVSRSSLCPLFRCETSLLGVVRLCLPLVMRCVSTDIFCDRNFPEYPAGDLTVQYRRRGQNSRIGLTCKNARNMCLGLRTCSYRSTRQYD